MLYLTFFVNNSDKVKCFFPHEGKSENPIATLTWILHSTMWHNLQPFLLIQIKFGLCGSIPIAAKNGI